MPNADEEVGDEEVGVGCAVALGGLRIVAVTIESVAGAGVSLPGARDVADPLAEASMLQWGLWSRQNFESRAPCSTAAKWRLRPRGWPPCACSVLLTLWFASCC